MLLHMVFHVLCAAGSAFHHLQRKGGGWGVFSISELPWRLKSPRVLKTLHAFHADVDTAHWTLLRTSSKRPVHLVDFLFPRFHGSVSQGPQEENTHGKHHFCRHGPEEKELFCVMHRSTHCLARIFCIAWPFAWVLVSGSSVAQSEAPPVSRRTEVPAGQNWLPPLGTGVGFWGWMSVQTATCGQLLRWSSVLGCISHLKSREVAQ